MKSWGRGLALTLVLLTVVFRQQTVKAYCDPAQCTPYNENTYCNPGQHCTASCCVDDVTPPPPDDGGGDACSGPNDCGGGECCRGGICRTDCGSSTPVNSPIGFHDVSNCNGSAGWTCDGDDFNQAVTVHLWDGIPPSFGGTGTFLGSTVANLSRPDVAGVCGGTTLHGFNFATPDSIKNNANHSIYAYAINLGATGATVLLGSSPKTINCPPPCTNTAPAAPTLNSPTTDITSLSPLLQWSHSGVWGTNCSGNTNQFDVFIQSCAPSPAAITNPTTLLRTVAGTTLSTSFTGVKGQTYCWKVVAKNGALSASSAPARFTILDNKITGTVYFDPEAICSTTTPQNVGGALSIAWGSNTGVFSGGNYTISTTSLGTNNLILGNIPAGYVCTPSSAGCNSDGCNIKTGIPYNTTNKNFFLTNSRSSWWQVEGGGVYAGSTAAGVNIRSLVPPAQDFILPGALGEVGLLMRAAGSYDVTSLGGDLSATNWNAVSRYRGRRLDYKYIAARQGVSALEVSDPVFLGGDEIIKPAYTPKDFWFIRPPSGTAVINNPWVVSGGESYVVIVDGDLLVNANVLVDSSSFVGYVVSGNIIIDPAVTDLQGVYVADGVFETESLTPTDDTQLVVQGTIVGWAGVTLRRDLGSANVNTPAEKFVYRPDLISGMPQRMRTYILEWTEVPAGTFGD